MSNKRTYINLINDFWEADTREQFSAPVTRIYFYLLNRINRNRWEPVLISDVELAEASGLSRNHLPGYREILKARGFMEYSKTKGTGRKAGIVYFIPGVTAPKEADTCTQKGSLNKSNCTQKGSLDKVTAPKEADTCTQKGSLEPSAPISVSIKTYLRPPTSTEDMRTRDVAAAVEVEAVEVPEVQEDSIAGAADRLLEKKKKAASQGAEVLKAFFHETNSRTLETLCMQNRVGLQELREIAERIVDEWTQDGKTHDDPKGNFNIGDATKHLRLTIPIKKGAEARAANAPKTREQHRQELINAAYAGLQQIMNGDLPEPPEEPAPF